MQLTLVCAIPVVAVSGVVVVDVVVVKAVVVVDVFTAVVGGAVGSKLGSVVLN